MRRPIDQFIDKTRPHYWLMSSIYLKHSADILLSHMRTHSDEPVMLTFENSFGRLSSKIDTVDMIFRPYMFLAGLSIENLLKAICLFIDSGQVDTKTGTLSGKILSSKHNLRSLATRICLNQGTDLIDLDEIGGFLDKLQQFILWAGRYPVPRHSSQLQSLEFDLELDSGQVDSVHGNLMEIMRRIGGVAGISPYLKWPL